MAKYTPMIEQYLKIKAQYQDAFLFFRLGDFYEMFFDDAKKAAKELEITLTSRDGGGDERIPMCGVPYHAATNYINRLIEKGYKIAICEQTEDPKAAKGVVKREVVQVITPGTVMDEGILQEKENNFICSVVDFHDDTYGIAAIDLTTGESRVTLIDGEWNDVISELYSIGAKEIIVPPSLADDKKSYVTARLAVTLSFEEKMEIPAECASIVEHIEQTKLIDTLGLLLQYLQRTQMRSLQHLQKATIYQIEQYMKLDIHSKRNLELVETIRSKDRKGSLLWLLDKTVTAMGGRLLRQWIERPLLKIEEIKQRQQVVESFIHHFIERQELRQHLQEVYDLERLVGKISYGTVNARELLQLKLSLQKVPNIIETVEKLAYPKLKQLKQYQTISDAVVELLEKSISDNPPISIKDGDIIKDGYNDLLDTYRAASKNGKQWIAELEQKEKEITGIKSLKVGYNKVFGYYIEVTRANLALLPKGRYERKQTLANAERFITPELKEKEALILEAEEKSTDLEYELFVEIREQVKKYIGEIQQLAKIVSELDVLQSFATISEEYQYTKPEFTEGRALIIQQGRHPVVEKVMNAQEYVANDFEMNEKREILLITGPNMSGKSTYMRQLALTAILAQIGCFIPAEYGKLPIFDQVFTRIGAADDLVSGQSTFMVEMMEARQAIAKATQNSLILLDEIGRGTSTYDGMAIAQAIVEYIHDNIGAKTLFSTHYHELTQLEKSLSSLVNVHVKAVEENGKVVFLHKVEEGHADKSYGIHVAELAELPEQVITRAKELLAELEQTNKNQDLPATNEVSEFEQLSLFVTEPKKEPKKKLSKQEQDALEQLKQLNILEMTPLEALNRLYELQKMLKS